MRLLAMVPPAWPTTIPPPLPTASLPLIVLRVIAAAAALPQKMPPPVCAELCVIVLEAMIGCELPAAPMPPPLVLA